MTLAGVAAKVRWENAQPGHPARYEIEKVIKQFEAEKFLEARAGRE